MKKICFSIRKVLLPILALTIVFILTSCGIPKPPNEEQMKADLMEELRSLTIENPLSSTQVEVISASIKSLVLEKRQTNDKADEAYCKVEYGNDAYSFTRYLKLIYNYYDKGGWSLDGYRDYAPSEWKLLSSPFTSENELMLRQNVQSKIANVEEATVYTDLENGTVVYSFPVSEQHQNGHYSGSYVETLTFDGSRWSLNEEPTVNFVWDIDDSVWTYRVSEPGLFGRAIEKTVDVYIDILDSATEQLTGYWSMSYKSYSTGSNTYGFGHDLPNDSDLIRFEGNRVTIVENSIPASSVTFSPDHVKASYTAIGGYLSFYDVELERTE